RRGRCSRSSLWVLIPSRSSFAREAFPKPGISKRSLDKRAHTHGAGPYVGSDGRPELFDIEVHALVKLTQPAGELLRLLVGRGVHHCAHREPSRGYRLEEPLNQPLARFGFAA